MVVLDQSRSMAKIVDQNSGDVSYLLVSRMSANACCVFLQAIVTLASSSPPQEWLEKSRRQQKRHLNSLDAPPELTTSPCSTVPPSFT